LLGSAKNLPSGVTSNNRRGQGREKGLGFLENLGTVDRKNTVMERGQTLPHWGGREIRWNQGDNFRFISQWCIPDPHSKNSGAGQDIFTGPKS